MKKSFKDMMLNGILPGIYQIGARRPIRQDKVLFVEYTHAAMQDAFRPLWKVLSRRTDFSLQYYTLARKNTSGFHFFLKNLRLVWKMSDAAYIFVREPMTVTSAIRLRPDTTMTQLWHACGAFKRFGCSVSSKEQQPAMYRNYRYVTVSSPQVVWAYEEAMGLADTKGVVLPLGISRTDVLYRESFREQARSRFLKVFPEASGKKVILYAPTFRGRPGEATAPVMPDLSLLADALQEEFVLLIRQHPSVKERPEIPAECSDFARDFSQQLTIAQLLCVSDLCITDYSSLVFEYALFSRPMIFYAYDLDEYEQERGFYYPFEEMTPGPVCRDTQELIHLIQTANEWFDPDRMKSFCDQFMSACDGHATERILKQVFQEQLKDHWLHAAKSPSKHTLSPMQEKLLEMLHWFHAFCEEHHLTYYAVGGTMLGAMRHQGFIPWDDDLDIGMPRSEYERLWEIMHSENQNGRYRMETIHVGAKDYLVPHAKIFDTSTTLIERKKVPCKRGLYIDILPLDGVGDTYEEALRTFRPIAMRLDLLAARVCALRPGRSVLKNASILIARGIPSIFYNENRQMLRIDRMCSKRPFETSEYVADLYGIKRKKEIMRRAYFGTPHLYSFENMEIYGVEDPENYLTQLFGDWRKYPPVSEQVTHHDYEYCDLNHSYLDEDDQEASNI